MEPKAKTLREKVLSLDGELSRAKNQLESYETSCTHRFGKETYDPIITEGYTIHGDPVGTMGVDWRGPTYVPAKTEDRWRRDCSICGIVEYTSAIEEEILKKPRWR